LTNDRVTIVVPYYNTPRIMKVCLRALRRFTSLENGHEVVVVNNGTTDGSDEYLRGLRWIRFIDRQLDAVELGSTGPEDLRSRADRAGLSHGRAINRAWDESDTPFFLTIHSDTIVRRPDWLEFLVGRLQSRPRCFGSGSWKLERRSLARRCTKHGVDLIAALTHPRRRKRLTDGIKPFLRSHCALYRRSTLEEAGLRPFGGEGSTCGQEVHYRLVEQGWEADFVPAPVLIRYLEHINHGTMVLNPELGTDERTIRKGRAKLDRFYARRWVRDLESDASLDA